jgi:DNA-binding LacI/PurR family transcriptional regulator
MGKVRLADIAEKVGVSAVTVHNALSGNKGVSEEVRSRIQQVAAELGYQTRVSKEEGSEDDVLRTIGVLVAENYLAQYETFYWKVYQEMAFTATERHCLTAVEVLKKDDELNTLRMPSCIEQRRVDGLIVLGEISKPYILKLKSKANVPVVFLDFYDKDLAQDAVIADGFYGTFLLTEYMFERGVDELGYVGSIYVTSSIMDRYCGFMKSMLLHHKSLRPEWLIEDRDSLGQMGIELPEHLPKGFVCNCDLAAYMLMDKLRERGLRVPEDISVVGFDNYLYPGLADRRITTYEVNTKTMTKVAINKILKQIKNPRKGRGLDVVSGRTVIKNSVI